MHAASSSFSIELNHLAITKKMASALRLLPLVLMSLVVSVVATKSPGRPLFREYIGPEGTNVTFAEVPVHPGVDFGELWRRYGREFVYVNFQFYAYSATPTVPQFLGYYDEQSRLYNDDAGGGDCAGDGKMVLVGFGTDPASGGLKPGKGFFRACRALRRQGRLHGVFVWALHNSDRRPPAHDVGGALVLARAARRGSSS
jgi:hypothetical protein